jgi:hypothetical protein
MRTTVNINRVNFEQICSSSKTLGISRNEVVAILLSRMSEKAVFKAKLYNTVRYQASDPDAEWMTMHVKFKPVRYEKMQDMRRSYKFSVSWFLAFAVSHFLDDMINEMLNPEKKNIKVDNYDHNFTHISQKYNNFQVFISIWGKMNKKKIKKLL